MSILGDVFCRAVASRFVSFLLVRVAVVAAVLVVLGGFVVLLTFGGVY